MKNRHVSAGAVWVFLLTLSVGAFAALRAKNIASTPVRNPYVKRK